MDKIIDRAKNPFSLRAVKYGRVSTPEQAQKKTSIPQQFEDCNKVIIQKGWISVGEHKDEGISGHLTEERYGLQSMLRDAREHKFDLIIVKDYDRFARNKNAAAIIRQELKELGIQVYAINTPVEPRSVNEYDPDDDDSATIMETVSDMRADLERTAINRRMKGGRMIKAKAGKIPNRVPYGLTVIRTIEGSKIKRTVIINEDEAEKVRFIFNEYARGIGDRKIAIEMNKRGWKGPNGGNWSIQEIKYILANITYTGKVSWGWRHAEYKKNKEWQRRGKTGYIGNGEHPAIVDETIFNLVKEIRAGKVKHGKGGSGRSFGILTGLAKCSRCKSGVGYQKRRHQRSKKNPNWKDTTTQEYICTGYKYRGICSQRVMSANKLEGAVLDHIKNLYSHPKVQENITYGSNNQEDIERERSIIRLQKEIEMGSTKEQRHKEMYEKGLETMEDLEINISRIREEVQKNRARVDKYIVESSTAAQKMVAVRKLVSSLKDFDVCWGKMELDEKKMILRSIIKEIRAGDGRVEIDFIL